MKDTNGGNAFRPDDFEPTREDVLIGRVVDGEASSTDWEALERLASGDATVWERVGRAQRTHARLEREVEDAIAIAELIEAPSPRVIAGQTLSMRIRQYGGWAAAAAVALAWVGLQRPGSTALMPNTGGTAGIASIPKLTADQALAQYVQAGQADGRVLGEMQPMLVSTRALGDGQGKEVWYVRPILERATVTDLNVLSVGLDEHGTPRYFPVPIAPEERRPAAGAPAVPVRRGEAL
jgi:hypothetical protein